jgi:ribonuclease Z
MAKETYHSTATDAARCALNAGAKRLLMGHFSSRYKDYITILHEAGAVFNNSEAAEAGKEYEVDLVKPERA